VCPFACCAHGSLRLGSEPREQAYKEHTLSGRLGSYRRSPLTPQLFVQLISII